MKRNLLFWMVLLLSGAFLLVGVAAAAPAAPPLDSPRMLLQANPTPTPANTEYDGDWKGNGDFDSPFIFTVENNQITAFAANVHIDKGNCEGLSSSYSTSGTPYPIEGKSIRLQVEGMGGLITATGSFTSATEAAGTLQVKGNASACGAYEITTTWAVKKAPPAPTVVPPSDSSADLPEVDSEQVLRTFFDSVNDKNMPAAMALVEDGAIFTAGSTVAIGKEEFAAYWEDQVQRGVTYAVSDVKDLGAGMLTFALKASGGTASAGNTILIADGKISILTLR